MKTQNSFPLPDHLSEASRTLYNAIRAERGLSAVRDLATLLQAIECFQRAESCRARIAADGGEIVNDRFGQPKPHPLLIPERQSRVAFAKLVGGLPQSSRAMMQQLRGDGE